MKKYALILLFCFQLISLGSLYAQKSVADSLEVELRGRYADDTVKVNLFNRIALEIFKSDSAKAISYVTHALKISDKQGFDKGTAESLWILGRTVAYHQNNNLSLGHFQKAVSVSEKSGNPEFFKYLASLGSAYSYIGMTDSAMACFERGHHLALIRNNKRAVMRFVANKCIIYTGRGQYEEALEGYRYVLELSRELGEDAIESSALNNIGRVYQFWGIYPQSLDYYFRSLTIKERLGDKEGIANLYNNIGNVLCKQGEYDKSLDYLQKALALSQKLNDKRKMAESYEYMGEVYLLTKSDQSLTYLQKAWEIVNAVSSITPKITVSIKMGDYYSASNQLDQALSCYERAMMLSRQVKRERTICQLLLKMGAIYQQQNDARKALDYSLQSMKMANQLNLLEEQKESYHQLSDLYADLKYYKHAYEHHQLFKQINDSIYNANNVRQVAEIEYSFQFEKEKQLHGLELMKRDARLKADQKFHYSIIISLVVAVLLAAILIAVVFLSNRRKRITNSLLVAQKNEIIAKNGQLQQLVATKDKFFSIIAHDLRGGFNSILGFSDLMILGSNDYSKQDMLVFAENIRASAEDTQRLLENLLEWSRSNLGLIVYKPVVFNLKKFIDFSLSTKGHHAINKEIDLRYVVDSALDIYADADMFGSILRNLISNAIKFTPRGGQILVEASRINGWIQISVKDNGVGMSDEVMNSLFSINKTVSTQGTEKERGTGLGLSICKEFVDRHKGEMSVKSEMGQGSEFIVLLPVYPPVALE